MNTKQQLLAARAEMRERTSHWKYFDPPRKLQVWHTKDYYQKLVDQLHENYKSDAAEWKRVKMNEIEARRRSIACNENYLRVLDKRSERPIRLRTLEKRREKEEKVLRSLKQQLPFARTEEGRARLQARIDAFPITNWDELLVGINEKSEEEVRIERVIVRDRELVCAYEDLDDNYKIIFAEKIHQLRVKHEREDEARKQYEEEGERQKREKEKVMGELTERIERLEAQLEREKLNVLARRARRDEKHQARITSSPQEQQQPEMDEIVDSLATLFS